MSLPTEAALSEAYENLPNFTYETMSVNPFEENLNLISNAILLGGICLFVVTKTAEGEDG